MPISDYHLQPGFGSILRQDPDVILVGEIRDLETADIAVQASLTGHLVLSTLHTNSAVGAVTRLIDMGVETFFDLFQPIGRFAQRLVRKLCEHCKTAYTPSDEERKLLDKAEMDMVLYRGDGCSECDFTGYRGRIGIYELVEINDQLRRQIHDREGEVELTRTARQQCESLSAEGFDK